MTVSHDCLSHDQPLSSCPRHRHCCLTHCSSLPRRHLRLPGAGYGHHVVFPPFGFVTPLPRCGGLLHHHQCQQQQCDARSDSLVMHLSPLCCGHCQHHSNEASLFGQHALMCAASYVGHSCASGPSSSGFRILHCTWRTWRPSDIPRA